MPYRRIFVTLFLVAGLAAGQSLSEMLQKGIYTQETVGDLDAAIKIYQQIVTEGASSRSYSAQAQYRLGLCYLQKGQKAAATAAFEKLIKEFPDQKELVEKAHQYVSGGPELTPVPWVDGEALEYIMRLEGGAELGTLVSIAETVQMDGKDFWQIKALRGIPMTPGLMVVLAQRDTFRPVRSSYRVPPLAQHKAEYGDGKVTVERAGKDAPQVVSSEDVLFDNEQAMHVIRRLPLAVGYKTTLPVFSPIAGQTIKLDISIPETKAIDVPAGKFDCFKIETKIGQTFWISTDSHRYPARLDAGGIIIELKAIGQNSGAAAEYRDEKTGFALRAPAGWFFRRQTVGANENESTVFIIDPEATATTVFGTTRIEPGKGSYGGDLRGSAQEKIAERQKVFKNYTVRPDSWTERSVNGRPAIGLIADFVTNSTEMTELMYLIGGDSFASWAWARLERGKVVDFQKQFNAVLDSFTLR